MKHKINIIITGLFLVLVFGFGIAFWIMPDEGFSEDENRVLQGFPTLTADGWLDGTVSRQLTEYYADQFPGRSLWVSLHALGELAQGRGEANGVLWAPGGQLAVRRFDMYLSLTERAEDTDCYDEAHIRAGLDAMIQLDGVLAAKGIPLTVVLAPRTIDVVGERLRYPTDRSDELDALIQTTLGGAGVESVELMADFRARLAAGEYVYFRTDHHWTSEGAYVAYEAILHAWSMSEAVIPADFYTVRAVPGFYGTTYSRAGMFFIPPDTLEIREARDGSDADFVVRDGDGKTVIEAGFISESYLSGKDKYGAFLDGTHRLLTITHKDSAPIVSGEPVPEGARPRLLLARDSFANSLVPYLARHYDIVMVNLTGGMTDLSVLAEAYGCERVLIVCNRENLMTSDALVRLS